MNHKIMFLVIFAYSCLVFSASDAQQKSQDYWKARSQTASEQKVDETLGAWIPGYNYVPGLAALIGEPVKEAALLGEGVWGISQGQSGSYGKVANVLGREAVGQTVLRIPANGANMSIAQLYAYIAGQTSANIIRPSNAILRSISALMYTSYVFNKAYAENIRIGGTQISAILAGIWASTKRLGLYAFYNWASGQVRQWINRINSGYLQASYYTQGNDTYNKKIDTIFENNPILFTLANEQDRKLLIAAKLAEMDNPQVFDNLENEIKNSQAQEEKTQSAVQAQAGMNVETMPVPIISMNTSKVATKKNVKRK